MAENLDNLNEQFDQREIRATAFKALFNVLQTTTFNPQSAESFAKGFPTFPDEYIHEADKIKLASNESSVEASRTRRWVTGSLPTGDSVENRLERLFRGHFETTNNSDPTLNPFVEEIIMPLTKVNGVNDQFYFAFGKENISESDYDDNFEPSANGPSPEYSTKEVGDFYLFANKEHILKNFVSPHKIWSRI